MKVKIHLFGFIDDEIPESIRKDKEYITDEIKLSIQYLIKEILKLKIDEITILLNGRFLTKDEFLKDGDQIKIFPPIAGG